MLYKRRELLHSYSKFIKKMKKLILASLIFMATGSLFAQAPAKVTKTKTVATQKATTLHAVPAKTTTTVTKTAVVKPMTPVAKVSSSVAAKPKVAVTTKSTAVVLKKDGTPDKRFKAVTSPVKKDGTPDMRYKQNKKS